MAWHLEVRKPGGWRLEAGERVDEGMIVELDGPFFWLDLRPYLFSPINATHRGAALHLMATRPGKASA